MNQQKAKQEADYIFKDVFGIENPFSLNELIKKFAIDIPTVHKVNCALSGVDTWSFYSKEEKIASQKAITDRFRKDEWLVKKKDMKSIDDILRAWEEIDYQTGEKYVSSKEVSESDGIYNSSGVYRSVSIFDSRNIIYSYKIFDSNYMIASRDDSSCTLGVRVKESIYCSSSFEVSWSNKVSKSMYIHDCFDLYECLFCSHLRSKKFRLKRVVIDWILKN